MRPVQAGMDPIRYRFFGRSVLTTVGAKLAMRFPIGVHP
jgi:hypothetical protein